MSKADNMLSILWMLRSGRKVTAHQIADELEIHVRTVYRCIDSLCASGAPIIADSGPNGGFRILGHFAESPLLFDAEEQKALVHASIFAKETGYPFTDVLQRAIDKLKRYTNEKQLHQMERHSSGLSVLQPPVHEEQRSLLQMLETSSAHGQTLKMIYSNGREGGTVSRDFDPYSIIHWKGQWYAAGYCRLRQEIRNFRVDRIIGLEMTDQHFERPADFSARDALLGALLPDPGNHEPLVTVVIQGHEHVLNELSQHWLFGHALVKRLPGEAHFQLGSSSLTAYVPYFLLPYGKSLHILEPASLVLKLSEITTDMAHHYEQMITAMTNNEG
ncbi:YafY family transcriptional regulator [Paenibacillus glucanolyticus]|jgi:predicted DNA-binding transcriptional regulator YafY|uniref:DNA-binding transcriptional regulator n=1 Tax=Paenibacillus glucanolyticus TaxID=59843 RepID=A0A163F7L4_9BACL|nr:MULTISPECIES: YafY family protein [Paenibacillus]ANA78794.1 DNA-binding transcriptional regulator [Paenibacillus glucanolyticus]AVV57292.1 YafY family transcriptional regulator [Paenibacillus glucanolyticus]AWP26448.1 DNA-binding transcriptional regulator [Paenibacillus sp. Cedars]ETT32491.1 Helix-turn-helix type 11 domain-containing protein [Paenibacillus sp. FSL R5-808]KZS44198.1 DNA-binding transcriptional regulator [Paenibacillus glucanolyticus]